VTAIRLDEPENLGRQIMALLKKVYLSLEGVEDEHWSKAREGWCKRETKAQ
jgi:hypothetical protein